METKPPITGNAEMTNTPKPKDKTYKVGRGKPPESGKIKAGEVRNPYGSKGKPKPVEPPPLVNDMFVHALTRHYQVQRNSDVVSEEAIQILIDSMITNAIKSRKAKDAIEVLKFMEKAGAFLDLNQQRMQLKMETEKEKRQEINDLLAKMDARMKSYPTFDSELQHDDINSNIFVQTRGEEDDSNQGTIG